MKPTIGSSTRFQSLQAIYWSKCHHPLSHRVAILENGLIIDRFQTAVNILLYFITRMLFFDITD